MTNSGEDSSATLGVESSRDGSGSVSRLARSSDAMGSSAASSVSISISGCFHSGKGASISSGASGICPTTHPLSAAMLAFTRAGLLVLNPSTTMGVFTLALGVVPSMHIATASGVDAAASGVDSSASNAADSSALGADAGASGGPRISALGGGAQCLAPGRASALGMPSGLAAAFTIGTP